MPSGDPPQLKDSTREAWNSITVAWGLDPSSAEVAGQTVRPPADVDTAAPPGSGEVVTLGPPGASVMEWSDAFSLDEPLGEGGMGVVFEAQQRSLTRRVAVKMLKGGARPGSVERFVSEARVTALLDHPNIVPVHALGTDPQGGPVLAMKRIEGETWEELLRREPYDGTPGSLRRQMEILQKVTDALAFAHEQDIVHRDLKPENVMVGAFGEVYVVDWGLALDVGHGPEAGKRGAPPAASAEGSPAGTPAYMAPEMADGGVITPATDVYLLGAILHRIFLGRPPHRGSNLMAVVAAALRNDLLPLQPEHSVPWDLLEVAVRCLASDPAERYSSARELRVAIQRLLAGEADREESLALCERADHLLRSSPIHDPGLRYQRLLQVEGVLQTSLQKWPQNTQARDLLDQVSAGFVRTSLEAGDLLLAETFVVRVPDPQAREGLRQEIVRRRVELHPAAVVGREDLRRKLRTFAAVAIFLLVMVGMASVASVVGDRRTNPLWVVALVLTGILTTLHVITFVSAGRLGPYNRGHFITTQVCTAGSALGWIGLALLMVMSSERIGGFLIVPLVVAVTSTWLFARLTKSDGWFVSGP